MILSTAFYLEQALKVQSVYRYRFTLYLDDFDCICEGTQEWSKWLCEIMIKGQTVTADTRLPVIDERAILEDDVSVTFSILSS